MGLFGDLLQQPQDRLPAHVFVGLFSGPPTQEHAAPLDQVDEALFGQLEVDPPYGLVVDPQCFGQLPDRGQPVPLLDLPAVDRRQQLSLDLLVELQLDVLVEIKPDHSVRS